MTIETQNNAPISAEPVAHAGLLPCPFCGGSAHLCRAFYLVNVRCDGWSLGECLGAGPNHYTEAEAVAGWNRRAAPVSAQAQQPVSGSDGLPTARVLIDGTAYELPAAVAAELLRLHLEILRAEQERAAHAKQDADKVDAEPDMFWNADNPEQCQDSIVNLLVEVQCDRTLRVGDVVEVQRAVSLPNVSIRITEVDSEDGDGDLEYEIIDGVAIDEARKEG